MEVKKIHESELTENLIKKLKADGYEYAGPMADKYDGEGNLLVKKSDVHKFVREIGTGTPEGDVVLSPEDVHVKLRHYFG